MTERLVRIPAPEPAGWRAARFGLAFVLLVPSCLLFVGWLVSGQPGQPVWFALLSAAGAIWVALATALRDDMEVWVHPEGLTVRRRNLFRTLEQTIPVAEVKGIGVRTDWLGQFLGPRLIVGPHFWRVVIDTARHGRIHGGGAPSEKEAAGLELRVRKMLGW
ncbi:MAG TPA: hypothetical protein VGO52_00595 [Hyphomonadaceae bacterium]|jgi:hypothetical protein|nr:hypothetical protein [Hyphomonadaceae bacterium]